MNLSALRRVTEKRVNALICLLIFGVMVVAAFWPFHFHPANRVSWLGDENGLRFGVPGIICSLGKLRFPNSESPAGATLEIWLEPSQDKYSTALLAFSSSANPDQFRLRQSHDYLLVLQEAFASSHHSGMTAMWVPHAFQAHRRSFVVISSGNEGTTVYLNGVPLEKSSTFKATAKDFSGQLIFGSSAVTYDTWRGKLLGMAIFGREISAAQVSEHYKAWLNRRLEGIKNDRPTALYIFEEHLGDVVHNQTSEAPDLVIPQSFHIPYKPLLKAPWKEFAFDRGYLRDILINIAGFVPFGFFFCMSLSAGSPSKKAAVATVVLGAVFSLTIEILQLYIPMRDSGTTDILTNTLGTAIGALLCRGGILRTLLDRFEFVSDS